MYLLWICTCIVDCYEEMGNRFWLSYFPSLIPIRSHALSHSHSPSPSPSSFHFLILSFSTFLGHFFPFAFHKITNSLWKKKTNNNLLLWIIHSVGVKYRDHLRLFKFVSTQRIAFLFFSSAALLFNWIQFACFVSFRFLFFKNLCSGIRSNWLFRLFEFGLNFFFFSFV